MVRKLMKWETIGKIFLLVLCLTIVVEVYFLSKSNSEQLEEEQFDLFMKEDVKPPDWAIPSAPTTGEWQPVVNTRHKFYVYSAHYSWRLQDQVRIIGATLYGGDSVACTIFPSGNTSQYSFVPATVVPFNSKVRLPFSAVSITCPLPPGSPAPLAVSVISTTQPRISNLLKVQSAPLNLPENKFSLVACVEPITNFFSQTVHLIEFIEMNTLLGVNHFMFYNQSTTPEVSCLLQHYAQQGRVTVLPWEFDHWSKTLKKVSQGESTLAAANDCLQRSRKFSYAVFLGMDQFVVPRSSNNFQEFIKSKSESINWNVTGALSISNVNFYHEWPDHVMDSYTTISQYMVTMLKTQRTEPNCADSPKYSALICKPYYTLGINAEYLPELVSGLDVHKTNPSEILSHLYVSCGISSVNCSSVLSVLDTTLHRHKNSLNLAMITTWKKAMPECTLHDKTASIKYKHNVPILTN